MIIITLNIPDTEKHFKAFICPDKHTMYEAVKLFKQEDIDEDFAAITCPFDKFSFDDDGNEMTDDCIGHLYFSADCLGGGLVSHEMLHAALSYERRFNNNPNCTLGEEIGDVEERVAYILTSLCDQFIEKGFE